MSIPLTPGLPNTLILNSPSTSWINQNDISDVRNGDKGIEITKRVLGFFVQKILSVQKNEIGCERGEDKGENQNACELNPWEKNFIDLSYRTESGYKIVKSHQVYVSPLTQITIVK